MGQPKALLPVPKKESFVSHIVRALRDGGVADVVVVVSPTGGAIRSALSSLDVPPRVVINPDPDRGQLSSLLAGLHAIDHPGVAAMLLTLVDVPLVSPATVQALLRAHEQTRAPVVRPSQEGRHGHPVLFDRTLFNELRNADPSTGAKAVVHAHLDRVEEVPTNDPGPFVDVDTPADYEQAFGQPIRGVQ